jgi:single-strand DNA-binding protein
MYNKVVLVGYLTRDVEIRYSQSGSAIGNVGIATNRRWKSQTGEQRDETMFIDLTFFGRTAEIANQYLRKGSKVLVDGRLIFQQWTAQDGTKRSKHSVTVENLTMLDTKAESRAIGNGGGAGMRQEPQPQASSYQHPTQPAPQSGYGANSGMSGGYGNANSSYNGQQQSSYEVQQSPVTQQQPSYGQPQQTRQTSVPEINIDEDEIPF